MVVAELLSMKATEWVENAATVVDVDDRNMIMKSGNDDGSKDITAGDI